MRSLKGFIIGLLIAFLLLISLAFSVVLGFGADYVGTIFNNKTEFIVKKADDATNYETLKVVEDTARSMISSYEADLATYNQYKDSDNEEKQSWAEQALMRANRTATNYNHYILKNSFIWKDSIPSDITQELQQAYKH